AVGFHQERFRGALEGQDAAGLGDLPGQGFDAPGFPVGQHDRGGAVRLHRTGLLAGRVVVLGVRWRVLVAGGRRRVLGRGGGGLAETVLLDGGYPALDILVAGRFGVYGHWCSLVDWVGWL